MRTIAQTAVDNEKYFCDLDAVVGDGDFGYSLARGFEIVLADWDELDYDRRRRLLKKTALDPHQADRRHLRARSGARPSCAPARSLRATPSRAAPRWSRRCAPRSRASSSAATPTSATRRCSTRSSRRPTRSRQALGDGRAGRRSQRAAATARESAEATKGMLAQRGRASYTGERSRDSVDAGAIGVAVMFEAVSKAWREAELERA